MRLGKKLKLMREKKGMTLRELSKLSKVSISHISDIENGRNDPSITVLGRICAALDTSVGVFMMGVDLYEC